MEIKLYKKIPLEAVQIRKAVFMEEQGYQNEFDEIDAMALHFVAFFHQVPAGTCRMFWEEEKCMYIVGRIDVLPAFRGKQIGTALLAEAQRQVSALGGKEIYLHAQCDKAPFYEKAGYRKMGNVDEEEGHPHIWMFRQWD